MKNVLVTFIIVLASSFAIHAQDMGQNENPSPQTTTVRKIKVFPNPATNVVNILGLENSSRADILVTDIYGNAILKHQWHIKNNAVNIPIASLDSGIYMVTIISQEQKVQTKFYKK